MAYKRKNIVMGGFDNNEEPPTYNVDTITNWENFANAIVVQAVNDYRRGLSKIKRHIEIKLGYSIRCKDSYKEIYRKYELEYAKEVESKYCNIIPIEKFFYSDYFKFLTDFKVDPLYIINGVRREMNIPIIPS